ncbi:MAG: hypothetical protein IKP40_05720 [Clostridia bacterium]|nr:hypothetical protein [Clostridia bacterium]
MKHTICALVLILCLLAGMAAVRADTVADLNLYDRALASLKAEEALEEKYGLTQPMLCYFPREMEATDNGWRLYYIGLDVFNYVLGYYTVTVEGDSVTCEWSWDGTEPQGFSTAPWGSAQLEEITSYVRYYSSYAPYFQMAEAIAASAAPRETRLYNRDDYLPSGEEIAPFETDLDMDTLREAGRKAVLTRWGITPEQAVQLSDEDFEPSFRRIDGFECVVFFFHLGTRVSDTVTLEEAHPEWLPLVGLYAVAVCTDDGAIIDWRYDADLTGNG